MHRQPSASVNPPPLPDDGPASKDREQIRLLAIFHFILGGLCLVGIGFLILHYLVIRTVFSQPGMWNFPNNPNLPPREFLRIFVWFYAFAGAVVLAGCVLNVLSGFFLHQRRHRTFSLIVGGLNCLQVPFGTALGVFTIIVLLRDSVRRSYPEPFTR